MQNLTTKNKKKCKGRKKDRGSSRSRSTNLGCRVGSDRRDQNLGSAHPLLFYINYQRN